MENGEVEEGVKKNVWYFSRGVYAIFLIFGCILDNSHVCEYATKSVKMMEQRQRKILLYKFLTKTVQSNIEYDGSAFLNKY